MRDNESFKPNQSKWEKSWKNAMKQMEKVNKEFSEAMKIVEQNYRQQQESLKPFIEYAKQNQYINIGDWVTGNSTNEKKSISNRYDVLRNRVDSDSSMSQVEKDYYKNSYNMFEQDELDKVGDDDMVKNTTEKMSKEFSSGLQDMIKGYKDFSDVMQDMTSSLTDYMIKQFTDKLVNNIMSDQVTSMLSTLLGGALNWGSGAFGAIGGFIGGLFKHHSGGVIPSGASYSLPGTQEQLALLKGGERVLSPSENVNYENGANNQPIVVNTFNVKAWDSKDVSRYLLENKQLLNQITFEGIKYNNAQLRNMVRNA